MSGEADIAATMHSSQDLPIIYTQGQTIRDAIKCNAWH